MALKPTVIRPLPKIVNTLGLLQYRKPSPDLYNTIGAGWEAAQVRAPIIQKRPCIHNLAYPFNILFSSKYF